MSPVCRTIAVPTLVQTCSNLPHDAGQVEHLSGQVGHVTVEEDEERLDDPRVGGKARGERPQHPVDGAHQDPAQRHHQEADDTQAGVCQRHHPGVGKLLKQMVEDLEQPDNTV